MSDNQQSTSQTRQKLRPKIHCPVCLDHSSKSITTQCNHIFCVKCIFKWIFHCVDERDRIDCPLCRQKIKFNKLKWNWKKIFLPATRKTCLWQQITCFLGKFFHFKTKIDEKKYYLEFPRFDKPKKASKMGEFSR